MESMEHTKQHLREAFRQARDAMSPDERQASSSSILMKLRELPEVQRASLILTYVSFGSEVRTERVIEEALRAGKQVAVPRCVAHGHLLEWHLIDGFEGMERSPFGMLEPTSDPGTLLPKEAKLANAVALVPGLAFDAYGRRLGYGGGYYDRFLPSFKAAGGVSIGLCHACQLSAEPLPQGPHDVLMDIVVIGDEAACPDLQR